MTEHVDQAKASRMVRWPRGRHNGQRIVGVRVTLLVDVRDPWRSWEFEHA